VRQSGGHQRPGAAAAGGGAAIVRPAAFVLRRPARRSAVELREALPEQSWSQVLLPSIGHCRARTCSTCLSRLTLSRESPPGDATNLFPARVLRSTGERAVSLCGAFEKRGETRAPLPRHRPRPVEPGLSRALPSHSCAAFARQQADELKWELCGQHAFTLAALAWPLCGNLHPLQPRRRHVASRAFDGCGLDERQELARPSLTGQGGAIPLNSLYRAPASQNGPTLLHSAGCHGGRSGSGRPNGCQTGPAPSNTLCFGRSPEKRPFCHRNAGPEHATLGPKRSDCNSRRRP
jgi:hypothetical protein